MNGSGTIYQMTNKSNGKSVIAFIKFSNTWDKVKRHKAIGDVAYRSWGSSTLSNVHATPLFTCFTKDYKPIVALLANCLNTIKPFGYNDPSKSQCFKMRCEVCHTEKTYKWFNDPIGRTCAGCHKRYLRSVDPLVNERILAEKKRYRERHPDKVSDQKKQARLKKLDIYKQRVRNRYWADPEKSRQEKRDEYKRNPTCFKINAQIRTRRHRRATPKCLSKSDRRKIFIIYANRPSGYHVDHIIPIKGVNEQGVHIVSGLHVPWNLQYLTAEENRRKYNKVECVHGA